MKTAVIILSIVEGNTGKVLVKIITGADGNKLNDFYWWMDSHKFSLRTAYTVTQFLQIFDNDWIKDHPSLVVMDKDNILTYNDTEPAEDWSKETLDRYINTFNDTKFNPRWENGTAEYTLTYRV